MPLTTPAKRRLLFAISDFRFPISKFAPLATGFCPPSPRPSPPGRGRPVADAVAEIVEFFPFAPTASPSPGGEGRGEGGQSSIIGPNLKEFTAQTGRAPIVKMSRTMPPTPVAAP